jgi:flagellar biosynthetic protein FliR
VTEFTHETLIVPLLVFCRVGGCFMLLPGISSERVPVQLRLFISIAVALAITPFLFDALRPAAKAPAGELLATIVLETAAGAFLGFLVRIFFMALEFAATTMANAAGYTSVFSHAVESNGPSSPFASFVTLPAVALFFITDQHINVIRMLQASYNIFKVGTPSAAPPDLQTIVTAFGSAFKLTLQLSGALIVYSLTVNLAFGFLNKMVPQIPIYFVSAPFVVLGALIILLQIDKSMLEIFSSLVIQAISNLGQNG